MSLKGTWEPSQELSDYKSILQYHQIIYITFQTGTLSAEAETQARTREAREIMRDSTNGCTYRLGQQRCDCDKAIWRPDDLY